MPKWHPATTQTTEANIPSWRHPSPPSNPPSAPHITGRRSRGASASIGSPSLPGPEDSRRRDDDPTGNMLYFGEGLSPEQAMKAYKSPTPGPPPKSSRSSSAVRKPTAATAGHASGRDSSGYLKTGVGSTNPMNGTYSSLTYGGSLQYNYSGAQNYGAGTHGPAGNGLI